MKPRTVPEAPPVSVMKPFRSADDAVTESVMNVDTDGVAVAVWNVASDDVDSPEGLTANA